MPRIFSNKISSGSGDQEPKETPKQQDPVHSARPPDTNVSWGAGPLSLLPAILHWLQELSLVNVINIILLAFSGGSLFAAYKIFNNDWSVTKVLPAAISQDLLQAGCVYKQYRIGGVLNNVVERRFDTDGIAIYSLSYQVPATNSKEQAERMCNILKKIIKDSKIKDLTPDVSIPELEEHQNNINNGSSIETDNSNNNTDLINNKNNKIELDNITLVVKIDKPDVRSNLTQEEEVTPFLDWIYKLTTEPQEPYNTIYLP